MFNFWLNKHLLWLCILDLLHISFLKSVTESGVKYSYPAYGIFFSHRTNLRVFWSFAFSVETCRMKRFHQMISKDHLNFEAFSPSALQLWRLGHFLPKLTLGGGIWACCRLQRWWALPGGVARSGGSFGLAWLFSLPSVITLSALQWGALWQGPVNEALVSLSRAPLVPPGMLLIVAVSSQELVSETSCHISMGLLLPAGRATSWEAQRWSPRDAVFHRCSAQDWVFSSVSSSSFLWLTTAFCLFFSFIGH